MSHLIHPTGSTRVFLRSTGALGAAGVLTVTILVLTSRIVGTWN